MEDPNKGGGKVDKEWKEQQEGTVSDNLPTKDGATKLTERSG